MKTIDHTTIETVELRLARYLQAICVPVPSARSRVAVADMTEADYDRAGLAVAKIMKCCAEYLDEAGFDADDAIEIAERAEAEYSRLISLRAE